jgi:hypothetical protein
MCLGSARRAAPDGAWPDAHCALCYKLGAPRGAFAAAPATRSQASDSEPVGGLPENKGEKQALA